MLFPSSRLELLASRRFLFPRSSLALLFAPLKQCPCLIQGLPCNAGRCQLAAHHPEAFWVMPPTTLVEGLCSQSLERLSPGRWNGPEAGGRRVGGAEGMLHSSSGSDASLSPNLHQRYRSRLTFIVGSAVGKSKPGFQTGCLWCI